ncbi:unnamed protein product [Penicillium olsonii]|nr:unnamed protein product [Penicillium olsonii]
MDLIRANPSIVMHISLLTALSAVASLGLALPSTLQTRGMPTVLHELIQSSHDHADSQSDISTSEFNDFDFWVQYAGATYYLNDYTAKTGYKINCDKGNCPDVEKNGGTIFYDFSNDTITDTAGFIAVDDIKKAIVLAFRGSYSVRNWIADASFPYTSTGICTGCEAELGFWGSWKAVRENIQSQLHDAFSQNSDYELIVTGHSLGAAIASLAAADLRSNGYPEAKMYAYAAPRVANAKLAKHITDQGNNYRFTHINDPVPKLPLLAMGYVHISPEYYITAPNNATVKPSEVEVIEGDVSFKGNTGTGLPSISAFAAHHWYFRQADAGLGAGIPLKRSLDSDECL